MPSQLIQTLALFHRYSIGTTRTIIHFTYISHHLKVTPNSCTVVILNHHDTGPQCTVTSDEVCHY